jgi:hypothetical protein
MDNSEDSAWHNIDPEHIWIMDKLILARKLGYTCGPVGLDVPSPGWYIVRPCVNMLGLGLGAKRLWLNDSTNDLPLGFFWCEFFEGRHLSVDYEYGKQVLCVEGFKKDDTFIKWDKWIKTNDQMQFPTVLEQVKVLPSVNCEYIGGRLIEAHFRNNEDFYGDISEFIPVWQGEDTSPPDGYTYRHYPDVHGRIGAFYK